MQTTGDEMGGALYEGRQQPLRWLGLVTFSSFLWCWTWLHPLQDVQDKATLTGSWHHLPRVSFTTCEVG